MEKRVPQFIYEFGGILDGGIFRRKMYLTYDDSFKSKEDRLLQEFKHTDCFECVYGYETSDIDTCSIIGDMYFDFDASIESEDDYKKIAFEVRLFVNYFKYYMGLSEDEIGIYFSGHKGFHVVIPYQAFDIKPHPQLNLIYKQIALRLMYECRVTSLDIKIYDRKRLFRIPNTKNAKSGLYKVRLSLKQLYEFTHDELIAYASSPKENAPLVRKPNKQATKNIRELVKQKQEIKAEKKEFIIPLEEKDLLPCVLHLLENGAKQGMRNNASVALANSLMQSGRTPDKTFALMKAWNEQNNPPLSEEELRATFNSAKQMLANGKVYGCVTYKTLEQCQDTCSLCVKGK